MGLVFIGLGSNLGDRLAMLSGAVDRLCRDVGTIEKLSPLYETEPVLHPEFPTHGQAHFLNGVVSLRSALDPRIILSLCLRIEQELGRRRDAERPWGPRTLDLDLLAVDALVIEEPDLVLPHPRIHERAFVLRPFCDIAPGWIHPLFSRAIEEFLDAAGGLGMKLHLPPEVWHSGSKSPDGSYG